MEMSWFLFLRKLHLTGILLPQASDPNAPGSFAGGYSVLFKGTGAYNGKWGTGQTTSDGILTSAISPQYFLDAEAAAAANWESSFGIDIDGDSIISSTYDSLTLYSATTGAIKIKRLTQLEILLITQMNSLKM